MVKFEATITTPNNYFLGVAESCNFNSATSAANPLRAPINTPIASDKAIALLGAMGDLSASISSSPPSLNF